MPSTFLMKAAGFIDLGEWGVSDGVHGMHGEVSLWVCVICSTGGRRRE
jgi:hypothetical protein